MKNIKSFNRELQAIQDKLNQAHRESGVDPVMIDRYYVEQFNKVFNKYKVNAATSVVYI